MNDMKLLHPEEARQLIRNGKWLKPTSGISNGYIQANLAVLPKDIAFEFLLFCQRNPKSCPIITSEIPKASASQTLINQTLVTRLRLKMARFLFSGHAV